MDGLSNSGFTITVRCIAVDGDRVYVGGENIEIPGDGIAYWDTGSEDWHAVGSGIQTAQPYAMAIIDAYLS